MKNLNDFKVQELEGRLEMTSWCYDPCYNPCEPDPCPEPEPEPECPTPTEPEDNTNTGGRG